MNKKQINKIITQIIEKQYTNKCKKPSYSLNTLPNLVKHTFKKFSEKHAYGNTEKEHCLSVLKNAETLNENTGNIDSVKPKYDEGAKALLEKIASDLTKPLDESEWSNHELHIQFEQELIKRLNETNDGIYHIHNHPSKYSTPITTCLSEGDCNNTFLNPVHYRTSKLYNTVKCQMAVASNGTSMILINHNPVSTKLGFDENKFKQAVAHLQSNHFEYFKTINHKIVSTEKELIEKEIKKIPKSLTLNQKYELEHQIRNNVEKKVYKQIMNENKNNYPKISKDIIKEFEDLGFELKFDFSEVILK